MFQSEIIHALNYSKYHITVPEGALRMTDEELSARVQEQLPEDTQVNFIAINDDDPSAPANAMIMSLGHVDFLINPFTGEVYGKPVGTDFFVMVKQLHRFLLNVPKNYQGGGFSVGRLIIGITAIVMTLILLTGVILWIPRSREQVKNRLTVSTKHGARRFLYDSHVSLGIYAVLFLLLMSLTGPAWSFKWYNKAAQTVTGYAAQEQLTTQPVPPQGQLMPPSDEQQQTSIPVRHTSSEPIQQGKNFHLFLMTYHTGTWGGWLVKIIYFLAALVGATLPWTGYYMWYKRTHPKHLQS